MPDISLVIPVYNAQEFFKECIDSVLSQSFKNIEIILVDDGSTDQSGRMCDDYAVQYPFVTVLHQKNSGQSAARNLGVSKAQSDIICFIDSDDIAHPDMIKEMYSEFSKGGVGAVTCERIRGAEPSADFCERVDCKIERIGINEESLLSLFQENNTVYWTLFPCLIKKSIYEKYPLVPGRIMEDNAITCKWLIEAENVSVLHAPLYFYRENPNGTMNSAFSVKKLDFLWALEEQIGFYSTLGYDRLRGAVAKEYIMTALWFAQRAETELNDPELARKLISDAVKMRKDNFDCLSLTDSEERKLFKAAHPLVHKIKKRLQFR